MPPPARPANWHDLPTVPANSAVRRLAFDDDALGAVAHELGRPLAVAPFRVRGRAVHRLEIPVVAGSVVRGTTVGSLTPEVDQPATSLTFWTSMRRLDVINPWVTVVTTGIIAVDLVAGVEAVFRHPRGSVTVARNGRVMVRTGPIAEDHGDPATAPDG